jgi:hypothetical protein
LKRRVTAPAAKLHTFSKARMTLRTHHHDERRRMRAMPAVETASARWCQLIFRDPDLELSFDDLFGNVAANLYNSLIVRLARFRNSQHMFSGRERSQDHST